MLPAGLAALSGWLTAAWRLERAWAWYVAVLVSALRVQGAFLPILQGDPSLLLWGVTAFDALLLALRLHPGSRARVDPPTAPAAEGTAARRSSFDARDRPREDPATPDRPAGADTDDAAAGRDSAGPP